jgi:hypothetical protein
MRNFDIEIIESKKTSNNKIVRKTIRFKAKNKAKMNIDEVETYYKHLLTKGIDPDEIAIIGMSDTFRTMKAFDDSDIQPWQQEDYYQNKASDKTLKSLLTEFFFVDFVIKK